MKRLLIRLLCLSLCLMLPLPALAAPEKWLAPWVIVSQDQGPKAAQLTFEMDAQALRTLVQPFADAALQDLENGLQRSSKGDPKLQEMQERAVRQQQQTLDGFLNTYLPATAALLKEITILETGDANALSYEILLSGQHAMTFSLIRQADGTFLTTSDLYPSYTLQSPTPNEESRKALETVRHIQSALPDYLDYNILAEEVNAARLELNALQVLGKAQRVEDGIQYAGTEAEFDQLIAEMDLRYHPLREKLLQGISLLGSTAEAVRQKAMGRYAEGIAHADDLEATPRDAEAPAPETNFPSEFIYEIHGETVTEKRTRILEYTAYEDVAAGDTGVLRTKKTLSWEPVQLLRYSPTAFYWEESASPEGDSLMRLEVNAEEPDEITAVFCLSQDGMALQCDLRLVRTEGGQGLSLTIGDQQGGGLRLPGDNTTITLPKMLLRLVYDNSRTVTSLLLSVQKDGVWTTAPGFHSAMTPTNFALPTAQGLTVIAPNSWGAYTDAGYRKEMQTVAVPYLNRLVLTRLPKDARPLLTPLLALISNLVK